MRESTIDGHLTYLFDGDHRYEGGGFVDNPQRLPLEEAALSPLLVTTPRQHTLKDAILECISEATEYIKLCSFILEDAEILECLSKRSNSGEIALFILTNLSVTTFGRSLTADSGEEEHGKPAERFRDHRNGMKKLADAGAYVRASTESHAKFIIADGNRGILTSANITRRSLNDNYESGMRLRQSDLECLERIFDTIFQRGTKYGVFERVGNEHFVVQRDSRLVAEDFAGLEQAGIRWTLTGIDGSLLEALERCVAGASSEIIISTFSIVHLMALVQLGKNVQEFIGSRGGKVQILTRGVEGNADHVAGCLTLSKMGCQIYGDHLNHSKGMIADASSGILFTANIDGRFGLKKGFEVGADLSGYPEELKALEKFIRWQIDTAPYKYDRCPSHYDKRQLWRGRNRERGSDEGSPGPLAIAVTISGSDEAVTKLQQALRFTPAFVQDIPKGEDPEVRRLRIGTQIFVLRKVGEQEYHIERGEVSTIRSKETFFDFEQLTMVAKKAGTI